jgi:hypothetical protein
MTFPFCNQSDLMTSAPKIVREKQCFDAEDYETTQRRNGAVQCPKCKLWWPSIEDPDWWTQREDGKHIAIGWWGGVVCEVCDLLLIEQPDGHTEVYWLNRTEQEDIE